MGKTMKNNNNTEVVKEGKVRKVFNFMNPLAGVTKSTASQFKEISEVSKQVASRLNPFGAYERAKQNSRMESFNEAYSRLNLSEDDLMKSLKFSLFMSRLALILFFSCLFLAFYFLSIGNFSTGFPIISICFVHIAVQHRYAFRAYQIKKRKLGNHKEFLQDAHAWLQ